MAIGKVVSKEGEEELDTILFTVNDDVINTDELIIEAFEPLNVNFTDSIDEPDIHVEENKYEESNIVFDPEPVILDDSEPEPSPEPTPDPNPDAEPESEPTPVPEPTPRPELDPAPDPEPDPEPEPISEPPAPEPDPIPDDEPGPTPEPTDEGDGVDDA